MGEKFWIQYANVFIPLGISIIGVLISFFVYKEKVKTLTENVKELKTEMKEIRDKVIACETSLKEREPLTKAKSPISLTNRGEKFLNDSNGKEFVDNNFKILLKKVEDKNPQNAYDVQELSKEVVSELESEKEINKIKDFLFKDGSQLEDLFTVMAIYLRDQILKYKKWNVKDVDKASPTKK